MVGAGHNGLTLAAYLARSGLSVGVFERRHEDGGDHEEGAEHDSRGREHEPGRDGRKGPDGERDERRVQRARVEILQPLHVADEAAEEIPAAQPQVAGHERRQSAEEPDAERGEGAEREVVGGEPLAVAQHSAGDAERPDADDGEDQAGQKNGEGEDQHEMPAGARLDELPNPHGGRRWL